MTAAAVSLARARIAGEIFALLDERAPGCTIWQWEPARRLAERTTAATAWRVMPAVRDVKSPRFWPCRPSKPPL